MKPIAADVGVAALGNLADPGLWTGHGHVSAGCPASGQEQMMGTPNMPHLLAGSRNLKGLSATPDESQYLRARRL